MMVLLWLEISISNG